MHIDTVNAASIPIFVEILDVLCTDTHESNPSATINGRSFGDVTCSTSGGTDVHHDWISPKFEAPGSPPYELMRGVSAPFDSDGGLGAAYGPLAGVWSPVSTSWGFALTPETVQNATATFTVSIRQGSGAVIDTATWTIQVIRATPGGGGGGPGGGCFVYGTLMRMADGLLKEVQDIVPGDIMEEGGRVYQQQIGDASLETWYDVDGVIVTGTHTMCKDGVWMHVEDAGYPKADEDSEVYYVVSNYNHKMVTANGQRFTDYSEVEYQSSGWDDWVLLKLNGKADNETMRQAIESTQRKT